MNRSRKRGGDDICVVTGMMTQRRFALPSLPKDPVAVKYCDEAPCPGLFLKRKIAAKPKKMAAVQRDRNSNSLCIVNSLGVCLVPF